MLFTVVQKRDIYMTTAYDYCRSFQLGIQGCQICKPPSRAFIVEIRNGDQAGHLCFLKWCSQDSRDSVPVQFVVLAS